MSDYQLALGRRLRAIRKQQGLSLSDVEERSGGRWKAVVVGSYERGDRAVSLARLEQLAEFYGVPLTELLPDPIGRTAPERQTGTPEGSEHVVLDLTRVRDVADDSPEPFVAIRRFARSIEIRRGDFNGEVLTIRDGDLTAVAQALGEHPRELRDTLADHGLLRTG